MAAMFVSVTPFMFLRYCLDPTGIDAGVINNAESDFE
jgi:hypothetical protein